MKLLAFAASNSRQSINRQLVEAACVLIKSEVLSSAAIEMIDLNDFEMPIYSSDRENENGVPEPAQRFCRMIDDADALLISYAEHNGSYTDAFKNIFDWASRIDQKVFQDKPMVIMATSPGPNGGASVLATAQTSAPYFGATICGTFSLANFYEAFDVENLSLEDRERQAELREVLASLVVDRTTD